MLNVVSAPDLFRLWRGGSQIREARVREMTRDLGTNYAMPKPPFEKTSRLVRKTVITYHIAPTSFLGRVFAFVLAAVILIAALLMSLMLFWAVLTIVLFLIIYALWASRGTRRNRDKVIDSEGRQL